MYLIKNLICTMNKEIYLKSNKNLISTSKSAMSFLLLLISTPQWNLRKAQNSFCLEMSGEGRKRMRVRGRNGPNNVHASE
jgi:hypothetical protein